jgi:hypothetical protein
MDNLYQYINKKIKLIEMMSDFKKKSCNHCVYIRPQKDNFCVVLRTKITDIYNLYCDNFKVDIIIQRREEALDTKNDDGGSRRWWWLFNYSHFKLALI